MSKTIRLDPSTKDEPGVRELIAAIRELLTAGKRIAVTVAEEDELLSPQEVAGRLGYSRQHVRRLIDVGELDGEQLANSRYWKIPLVSVLAFEDRRAATEERASEFSRSLDRLGARPE